MMSPVPLRDAANERLFGGKCASLAVALQARLPVPDGFALSVDLVTAIARGDTLLATTVALLFDDLAPSMAVRSSAVGEDSADASFAGQHLSVLNVMSADAMLTAIGEVFRSAHTPEALRYRERMNIGGAPAIAVALQRQISSETAGVMFTRNPRTGADERYVEAAWGLGEAVVAGLIIPDNFYIAAGGEILDRTPGVKDLMLVADASGEVIEQEVEPGLVNTLCLTDHQLQHLHGLASECQRVYGKDIDIEWAFAGGQLYLLQCRAITR